MSALDLAARFVSPQEMRAVLRSTPSYVTNRDRVAAFTADGLALYDKYQKAKPYLFWGSLIGAIASAYAFEKRGRRPDNREGMILYGASFAVCAVTAFITRPTGAKDVPADAPPGTEPTEDGALVKWVDDHVAAYKAQDPYFADKTFERLVKMPGVKQSFESMHPLIQAAVV
jgi:pimeloyl-ACP methyl ester carboxylesterase